MSLVMVSTPIGNFQDITLRALETLKTCDVLICEELKPARILLKRLGIEEKELFQLNEHSRQADLDELVGLCRVKKVALVSDCGTPGFYDPGADLVRTCYERNIQVDGNPGPSSLMALISLSGIKLTEFYFVGFLPAEKILRQKKLGQVSKLKLPLILMDTPYRLGSTLKDIAVFLPHARATLGIDLTGAKNQVVRGKLTDLANKTFPKAPFVVIVEP